MCNPPRPTAAGGGGADRVQVVDGRRAPFVILHPIEARVIAGLLEGRARRGAQAERDGAAMCASYLRRWADYWEPEGLTRFADIEEGWTR